MSVDFVRRLTAVVAAAALLSSAGTDAAAQDAAAAAGTTAPLSPERALLSEARAAVDIADFAKGALLLERFAATVPADEEAPRALVDALALRLALGERDKAAADAATFEKTFGAKHLEELARTKLVMARAFDEHDEHAKVLSLASTKTRDLVVRHAPNQVAVLDVLVARAHARAGNETEARKAYERAAAMPIDLRNTTDDDTALRMLGRGLTAMGQAHLALADVAFAEAMRVSVVKKDEASITRKREAIERAEELYAKITAIEPMPPPKPMLDAAARVARMRSQLWAQVHLAFGAATSERLLFEAKAANRACVALAPKLRLAVPQSCMTWLTRHFPEEYPRIAELTAPLKSGFTIRPPALDKEGNVVEVTPPAAPEF